MIRLSCISIAASIVMLCGLAASADTVVGKANINTANAATMAYMPGIGDKLAAKIVKYRARHGEFRDCDGLVRVSGIGPERLRKAKPHCKVSGKSTIAKQPEGAK